MDSCAAAIPAGTKILLSCLLSLLLFIAAAIVDCLVVASCNTIVLSDIDDVVWIATVVDTDSIDELL